MNDNPRLPADIPEARELADLQSQMQRSTRRVNLDGGPELGWGTAVLLGGLSSFYVSALPKWVLGSPWSSWVGWLPMACMCFAPYAIPRMINRLITWPRIGYSSNQYELKLGLLIKSMFFGLAIGVAVVSLCEIISETQQGISPAIARGAGKHLIWEGLKLLISAPLAVYLGRNVITKRQLVPSAYDAPILFQRLRQTPEGQSHIRMMKFGVALFFVAVLLLVGGIVLGVIWLAKSMTLHTDWDWHQSAGLVILVVSNALLYLMFNAVAIRRYKWKWIALAFMLIAPILVNARIPGPTNQPPTALLGIRPPVLTAIGLVWFLSGALTLIAFIRQNPLPKEPAP